jgi:DNA (cytosine-5)-methyltransferase 1
MGAAETARPAAPPTGRPTFGSLFAGIGGLDLGLERAGWECRWQVEIDDYCRRVLAKHWPDVPKFGDIRGVDGDSLERVDLLCGGFPCQDISDAGLRAGLAGERSGLWSEYVRLIRALRPRLVLVENVAALLGRGMGRVLGDLADCGYDAEWDRLPASSFGLYHERGRVFIVAYPQGDNRPARRVLDAGGIRPSPLESRRLHSIAVAARARQDPTARLEREPRLARLVHGIPDQMERLEAVGNAVVPQVAEWLGRRLLETMA